ncbi:DgyrCDS13600 [Dimorphilus gyrociliatus]|uniref:Voltage-gated hydrogen channel 1 n=1 Tax=Dimorphilus gyrociliatus TaxID=2664684 RepID=A0A7I8WB57_9ANNE|nr:DgyrCDS13600 [Dimorphilus gyrociliatus]
MAGRTPVANFYCVLFFLPLSLQSLPVILSLYFSFMHPNYTLDGGKKIFFALCNKADNILILRNVLGQYEETQSHLDNVLGFIRVAHAEELRGYEGSNVDHILSLLSMPDNSPNVSSASMQMRRLCEYSQKSESVTTNGEESSSPSATSSSTPPPYLSEQGVGGGFSNDSHYLSNEPVSHTYSKSKFLLKIAHSLHFCSITILGIFVIQVLLKVIGMGLEFFKHKMEIFDAVIIVASFALDLVFLKGIGEVQGEEAAALLIVFLLWRILRVINGIMVTAKQRQEFRIKLQKRARRRAEKKIELLEDEKHLKDKEIHALKFLCQQSGASEEDIAACRPRRQPQRLDTSTGLTSVASLSLSLSMSMSAGLLNNIARSHPMLNRRESLMDASSSSSSSSTGRMRRSDANNSRSPRLRSSSSPRLARSLTPDPPSRKPFTDFSALNPLLQLRQERAADGLAPTPSLNVTNAGNSEKQLTDIHVIEEVSEVSEETDTESVCSPVIAPLVKLCPPPPPPPPEPLPPHLAYPLNESADAAARALAARDSDTSNPPDSDKQSNHQQVYDLQHFKSYNDYIY